MRRFIIFLIICIGFFAWFCHFFNSGKLQKYLDEHPNPSWGVRVQYYMGQFFYFRKERKKAIECAEKVLKVYPKSSCVPKALFLKAKSLHELGKRAEAIKAYKKYFETYPNFSKAKLAKKRYRRLVGID